MVAPLGLFSGWGNVLSATLILAFAAPGWALDVSGIYADKGTRIASEASQPPTGASLHALFSLEFDSDLANALFTGTSHVALSLEGSKF